MLYSRKRNPFLPKIRVSARFDSPGKVSPFCHSSIVLLLLFACCAIRLPLAKRSQAGKVQLSRGRWNRTLRICAGPAVVMPLAKRSQAGEVQLSADVEPDAAHMRWPCDLLCPLANVLRPKVQLSRGRWNRTLRICAGPAVVMPLAKRSQAGKCSFPRTVEPDAAHMHCP